MNIRMSDAETAAYRFVDYILANQDKYPCDLKDDKMLDVLIAEGLVKYAIETYTRSQNDTSLSSLDRNVTLAQSLQIMIQAVQFYSIPVYAYYGAKIMERIDYGDNADGLKDAINTYKEFIKDQQNFVPDKYSSFALHFHDPEAALLEARKRIEYLTKLGEFKRLGEV